MIAFVCMTTVTNVWAQVEDILETSAQPWPGLRRADAELARDILRMQPGMMHILEDGKTEIVWAKTVALKLVPGSPTESLRPGLPAWGPLDPSRWNIVVNGAIIDPRKFRIVYDERLVNLGTLFTYSQEFYTETQSTLWDATWN